MDNAFAWKEMLQAGWPIFSVLIFCSALSWAVILERWLYFRRHRLDVRRFLAGIEGLLDASHPDSEDLGSLGEPMARLTRFALKHASRSEASLNLALDREIRLELAGAERFISFLGTVASASPFIGLLGTVVGIIRAFHSLAVSQGGGPGVVAAGIAEALVATAVGLLTAIPALVAYNYFSVRVRRLAEDLEICGQVLAELLTMSKGRRE